jgi:hypothetical protein
MQEELNINNLSSKNISFPKCIAEKNITVLGENYWEELKLVVFEENERLHMSKEDFEKIKLVFGFVINEDIDELVLNPPEKQNKVIGVDESSTTEFQSKDPSIDFILELLDENF